MKKLLFFAVLIVFLLPSGCIVYSNSRTCGTKNGDYETQLAALEKRMGHLERLAGVTPPNDESALAAGETPKPGLPAPPQTVEMPGRVVALR